MLKRQLVQIAFCWFEDLCKTVKTTFVWNLQVVLPTKSIRRGGVSAEAMRSQARVGSLQSPLSGQHVFVEKKAS